MNHQLLALYGLKWNPFTPELPLEALRVTPKLENFCWRIEQALVREGGFALIQGDPGTGMMLVVAGQVRISVFAPDGREVVLSIIRPGQVFGEMALLDGGERSANATALGECELLAIDRRDFLPFLERRPAEFKGC